MAGSGSGNKRIEITDLERAEETDILRLESFLAADAHELARHQMNHDIQGSWQENPGLDAAYLAVPAGADILIAHDCVRGLMVRPDNATALGVDPGEGAFFMPSYPNLTADDSPYIAVKSAGLAVPNAILTFLANAGPGIRWDIVECQPNEVLLESTSRGIYNPGTNQFDPTVVPKVSGGELVFRMRRGTQGAGIPAIDPEWMPLAAVHVRTDATGFLDSDVYDVRPLVTERCAWSMRHPLSPPAGNLQYRAKNFEAEFTIAANGAIDGWESRGYFRGHFAGYYSGGKLRKNVPATNLADFGATGATGGSYPAFNWEDPKNQVDGGLTASDHVVPLGCFFPKGYPRWVRYSQAALTPNTTNRLRVAGRLPQGPRGFLLVTNGSDLRNGIITPQTMPTAMGEPASAWGHVVAYGLYDTSATAVYPPIGTAEDGKYYWAASTLSGGYSGWPFAVINMTEDISTPALWKAQATLAPGSGFIPEAARGLSVWLALSFAFPSGAGFISYANPPAALHLGTPTTPAGVLPNLGTTGERWDIPAGVTTFLVDSTFWMPLIPDSEWDAGGGAGTAITVAGFEGTAGLTGLQAQMRITGYVF